MGINTCLKDIKTSKERTMLERQLRSNGYSGFKSIKTLIKKIEIIFSTIDYINRKSGHKVVIENSKSDEEFRRQYKNLTEALNYFNQREFRIVNEFNKE